mmetsp:Transcript_75769/g.214187  ORF Transcript_75769/g.214187 Transcript_75769/m.214187 type:complete len:220 (-) Transcript_75769:183-842(-)
MELHVVDTEGIPDGCVLSVRAGSTRRQAPVAADRPFRFPTSAAEAQPFKVDVLEPVASARLILRPGEERRMDCQYTIPLDAVVAKGAGVEEKAEAEDPKGEPEMSVTIAVKPTEEQKAAAEDEEKKNSDGEGDGQPGSSKNKRGSGGSSASSRHGQANAAREYLDRHNLVEFTQLLVQSVIKEQPDKPYAFMAQQFYFPDPKPRDTGGADTSGGAPPAA